MAIPTISDVAGLLTDPTIRFTQNNKAVANVRVAFNDSRYNDQTRQWETTKSFYVDCTAWENTAERLAEHFRKGDQVYIEGRIETEEWEHEGQKRSKPNLTIRTIKKLEKSQQQPQQSQDGQSQNWTANPQQPVPPTTGGGWGDQSQTSVWAGGGAQQQGQVPF